MALSRRERPTEFHDKRKKKLVDVLAKDKEWVIADKEPMSLAQYNYQFTPPWKRLKEVSIATM
jgi:hypothetical protein